MSPKSSRPTTRSPAVVDEDVVVVGVVVDDARPKSRQDRDEAVVEPRQDAPETSPSVGVLDLRRRAGDDGRGPLHVPLEIAVRGRMVEAVERRRDATHRRAEVGEEGVTRDLDRGQRPPRQERQHACPRRPGRPEVHHGPPVECGTGRATGTPAAASRAIASSWHSRKAGSSARFAILRTTGGAAVVRTDQDVAVALARQVLEVAAESPVPGEHVGGRSRPASGRVEIHDAGGPSSSA